ncbi:MAG: hypothetical protein GHCLOJNM_03689 [bacterium]|nr:hypothetical protein [bacterium]
MTKPTSPSEPAVDRDLLRDLENSFGPRTRERIATAVERVVKAKRSGGKVSVVTGSGPNLHEGVTTLIAELIRVGVIDGVTTSSAVVGHEMGGTLDRVKRVSGETLGIEQRLLPHGGHFELTQLEDSSLAELDSETSLDWELIHKLQNAPGVEIIKAAGNLGYPMGLYLERLSTEILAIARETGKPFEEVAGWGADERTMIGAGSRRGIPVIVTIPQLVGSGRVGLAIGDSLSVTERARRVAGILEESEVIIESGVALAQEIHDGPFETHTGHGLWAAWDGEPTYSLQGKSLIRIDLDPNLEKVWEAERKGGEVQGAINQGLPKTKLFDVPFRMEMSGFARLSGSLPIIGDLGAVWPILALKVADALDLELGFLSYPQDTARGKAMREWIADHVAPISRRKMMEQSARTECAV